jgi:hypothetical protein
LAQLVRSGVRTFYFRGGKAFGSHQRWAETRLQKQLRLSAFGRVGQLVEQGQPLGKVRNRLDICGALRRLLPRPLPSGDGLLSAARLSVVIGQQFGLGLGQGRKQIAQRLGDLLMVLPSSVGGQQLIGRLLDENVPERVCPCG